LRFACCGVWEHMAKPEEMAWFICRKMSNQRWRRKFIPPLVEIRLCKHRTCRACFYLAFVVGFWIHPAPNSLPAASNPLLRATLLGCEAGLVQCHSTLRAHHPQAELPGNAEKKTAGGR
jgi:hypothetical protein